MTEQFKNFASTQLNGGIDDTVTTVTVDDAMGFTTGNFRIRIDDEIMIVTGISSLDFTVTRHAEGTSAASHANDAPVYHILTVGALDDHDQNDLHVYDAYTSKPAAGVQGRIFLPTDGIFLEHDNGSSWEKFGPIWPLTPPQISDFPTWVNQGVSTIIDNKGAIYFSPAAVSGDNLRLRVKAYPTPPFTVEMAFIPNTHNPSSSNHIGSGLCIRESGSGKIQCYGHKAGSVAPTSSYGVNYASATASSSGITGWGSTAGNGNYQLTTNLVWVKYVDDNSHRIVSISLDGYSWVQMVSLSLTDYLTPDQIGIIVTNASSGTEASTGATFVHWKQY